MPRDIQFLLKKYETRDVNEIWSDEHNKEFMQNIRTQERFELLDGIITERITKSRGTFTWPKAQKGRAKYLIKHFNFAGRISEKQYIAMIIVYVKLERNKDGKLNDYLSLLKEYGVDVQTFVRFLIRLNEYHIDN